MTRDKTTRKRGRREDKEEQSDNEGDLVLPIDSLISKKKRNRRTDDVDDLVGALLGDEPEAAAKKRKAKRQRTKEASRASRAATAAMEAEQLELDQIKYDDDDVADLYAWDSKDDAPVAKSQKTTVYRDGSLEDDDEEEKEEEEENLRAERQRILQLAMAAADDTANNDDMPRNEDDWFVKLDEEAHERKNGSFDDSDDDDSDMATDIVGKPAASMPHRAVVPQHKREATGKFLAIDCEMVGAGFKGSRSMLARVSVVNYYGHVIIDAFVTPLEPVTDYRTWVSGIRKQDLDHHGRSFGDVQREVAELIKDRVLVGHAIKHDLKALLLTHPGSMIRDTARYQGFRSMFPTSKGSMFSLRKLAASLLNITIQESEHSSVTDAKTTMLLYRKVKDEWEKALAPKRYKTQIKKIRTKERFDQLRSERKELRDQQAVQQKKSRHNPFQMPRLKE